VEDLDWRTPRGIDRAVFARLIGGDWIDRNENLLVTGATGLGKSWIACALGHKACRDNRSVQYHHRVPRLFEALALARGDGRYGRLLKALGRVQLLILDDWGLSVLNPPERRDLLEILDDRHGRAAMRSWIASFTTLTVFNLPEKACESRPPASKLLTQTQTPEPITVSVEAAAHDRVKYLLTIKRNERSPSREIAAHNQRNAHRIDVGARDEGTFAAQWLAYALPCQRFADALAGICCA
jgi:IstB-like ATP binding protein